MITMQEKGKALGAIAKANGGILTADAVVEAAKNPKSVLHDDFDWDDSSAARKFRLYQARRLITSIEVISVIDEVRVSAVSYIQDCRKDRKTQGYVAIDALRRRKEDSRATLLVELERIQGIVERSRSIAASLGLAEYFEDILEGILAAKSQV